MLDRYFLVDINNCVKPFIYPILLIKFRKWKNQLDSFDLFMKYAAKLYSEDPPLDPTTFHVSNHESMQILEHEIEELIFNESMANIVNIDCSNLASLNVSKKASQTSTPKRYNLRSRY